MTEPAKAAPAPVAPAALTPITPAKLSELLKAHRGQPVLVNAFASWCKPCNRELPELAALHKKHPKLWMLGIDVDEDLEAGRAFIAKLPAGFEVYHSASGLTPLLTAFGLPKDWYEAVPPTWERSLPVTLIYDAKGEFVTGSVGQIGPEAMAEFDKVAAEGN